MINKASKDKRINDSAMGITKTESKKMVERDTPVWLQNRQNKVVNSIIDSIIR